MKLEVTIQLLKFGSYVFNCIFLALGLSIAGCAVWILFSSEGFLSVFPSAELRTVGVGFLLIGGVVLLVALIGCAGTHAENRFLLLTYLGLLIVLVLGQLFVTLLLLLYRDKIEESLDEAVGQIISNYGTNRTSQDRLMDSLQKYGECCGRTGPADWRSNSFIQSLNQTHPHVLPVLPCSCFSSNHLVINLTWCFEPNVTDTLNGRGNGSYDQGCKEKLSDWLQENVLTIVGMDVALILIQVVQFIVTVYLYRMFSRKTALKKTASLADTDHAHTDHTHLDDNLEEDLVYEENNYGYTDSEDGYTDHALPVHYHDYQNHADRTYLAHHHDNQHHN